MSDIADAFRAIQDVDALAGAVLLLSGVWLLSRVYPHIRRLVHFLDDVAGSEARDGQPARPSLLARVTALQADLTAVQDTLAEHGSRLDDVHHQLHPNSGGSVRDAVVRVETVQAALSARVEAALTEHARYDAALAHLLSHQSDPDGGTS